MKKLINNKKVANIVLKLFGLCCRIGADSRRTTVSFSVVLALSLPLAIPEMAAAAQVYGHFRHSSADLWINRTESYQSAPSGPLTDGQPPVQDATLPPIYGKYRVDYGEIGVYANNDGSSPLPTSPTSAIFTNAGTTAGFEDAFTITAPGMPLGSMGTMDIRIDFTGVLNATGITSASYGLDLGVGQCCGQLYGTQYGSDFPGLEGRFIGDDFGSYIFSFPIFFGTHTQNNIYMQAHADAADYEGPGSATADLFGTFLWGGVMAVYDSSGAPVQGFEMVSQSGYDYATLKPAVVPVPAAVWLFGSGLLGLIGLARRKRKG